MCVTESAERNAYLALAMPWSFCNLRFGSRLGLGLHRFGGSMRHVGQPGQDLEIDLCHAFLLNCLHLQGIILDRSGSGNAAGNEAKNRYDCSQNQDKERDGKTLLGFHNCRPVFWFYLKVACNCRDRMPHNHFDVAHGIWLHKARTTTS